MGNFTSIVRLVSRNFPEEGVDIDEHSLRKEYCFAKALACWNYLFVCIHDHD